MKKKFLILIVVGVFLFSSVVFAKDSELGVLVYDIDDTSVDYTEANEEIYKQGLNDSDEIKPSTISEFITLNMRHYYQNGNQSWSNNIMQSCGSTISSVGCSLTSYAMVTNYYGSNDNPGQVNTKLGSNACPINWGAIGSPYGLRLVGNVHQEVSESYAKTFILGALRNDRPVIVGFTKNVNGNINNHFVVARGYLKTLEGEEFYLTYDPDSFKNATNLDEYFSDGWRVNRLKVYDK